jgi:hypothetical protein
LICEIIIVTTVNGVLGFWKNNRAPTATCGRRSLQMCKLIDCEIIVVTTVVGVLGKAVERPQQHVHGVACV